MLKKHNHIISCRCWIFHAWSSFCGQLHCTVRCHLRATLRYKFLKCNWCQRSLLPWVALAIYKFHFYRLPFRLNFMQNTPFSLFQVFDLDFIVRLILPTSQLQSKWMSSVTLTELDDYKFISNQIIYFIYMGNSVHRKRKADRQKQTGTQKHTQKHKGT